MTQLEKLKFIINEMIKDNNYIIEKDEGSSRKTITSLKGENHALDLVLQMISSKSFLNKVYEIFYNQAE